MTTRTTAAQRADLLHLIGDMGNTTISVRTETLGNLLSDAGADRAGLAFLEHDDRKGVDVDTGVLEAIIQLAEAREKRADALGPLTMDVTTAAIDARIEAGEPGIPVTNEAGRVLFVVMPDANGLFDHVARLRLSATEPTA